MMMNWYNFYFELDGTQYIITKSKNYMYIKVKTIHDLQKLTINIHLLYNVAHTVRVGKT